MGRDQTFPVVEIPEGLDLSLRMNDKYIRSNLIIELVNITLRHWQCISYFVLDAFQIRVISVMALIRRYNKC